MSRERGSIPRGKNDKEIRKRLQGIFQNRKGTKSCLVFDRSKEKAKTSRIF